MPLDMLRGLDWRQWALVLKHTWPRIMLMAQNLPLILLQLLIILCLQDWEEVVEAGGLLGLGKLATLREAGQ